MANISAGVYTKLYDLSSYVASVPSTTAFICALTEKGRDNELVFLGSQSELVSEWGEPNINLYGVNYSQGQYLAYNFLGVSGSLYFMRCLPSDATYSNLRLDVDMDTCDTSASISITYVDSLNTKAEITTNMTTQTGSTYRLCMFYPIGRGQYYNKLGVRLTAHSNPLLNSVYVMDIYEKQSDNQDVIIESFDVSFNSEAKDSSGSSLFIEDVLSTYSSILRAEVGDDGYNLVSRVYDKDIGNVSTVLTSGSATISDNKQDFSDWETLSGCSSYMVIAKDGKGKEIYGWLGESSVDDETVNVYNYREIDSTSVSVIQAWSGDVSTFDESSTITYEIKKSNVDISEAFSSSIPKPLKKGSEGSLLDETGTLDTDEATQLLSNGYNGTIDDTVLDTDNIYFTVVFDAGYPSDVKSQISTLVQTRGDCMGFIDNGDNSSYTTSISSREDTNVFNTKFIAIYEEYNKVYDSWTGKDIWFSPLYHVSYLLPRNDTVGEVWTAIAGFNRATIQTIKDIRFNPKSGQRDQFYLRQINPIVKFTNGYVLWSQLTSQSKASALQDVNIMRLYLYIKRALEQYAINYIFEQNDAITWNQVAGDITNFLESVKKKRGLYGYNVSVGADNYQIKTKTFSIDVTLQPTRVAEKIELNFFIE